MLKLVVWRSTCRESGAQCVLIILVLGRLMLPAGNWGIVMLLLKALLVFLGKNFDICEADSI